jgi:DNA-binding transcriptional ArsR family regulator
METLIPERLSVLGHPQRLAILRLLMRRYPDRVPAGDIARALDMKASTLSNYLSNLMQVGLVTQERSGTSLLYAPDMDASAGPSATSSTIAVADGPICARP